MEALLGGKGNNSAVITLLITFGFGGFITSACWFLWAVVYDRIKRYFVTQVIIDNTDAPYKWVLKYLTEKGYLATSMNQFVAKIRPQDGRWWDSKRKLVEVDYFPAPGAHSFIFNGRKLWAF